LLVVSGNPDLVIAFALVFGLWLVFTVAIQFDASSLSFLARYDVLGFLPRWTFFAPTPGHTDIRVLMRVARLSRVTAWSELWLSSHIDEQNTLMRGLFNPYRRIEKLLFDFRNVLTDTNNPAQIRMCSEYIALLTIAEKVAEGSDADTVQFMLAETNYNLNEPFKVILVSDMHSLHSQL
jgi:hypothetical protein